MTTQKIQIDYHSELMKNYVSHIPIKEGNDFKALLDHNNQPLLFSIGSDNRLRLIYQNSDDSAPWSLIKLGKHAVTCFDIAQSSSGAIRIAYACIDEDKPKIFYTELSSNNCNKSNVTENFKWSEHKIEDPISEINRIEIDDEYFMFSTKTNQQEAHYYYAQYGDDNTILNLPELGSEIINFKVGTFSKKIGVFLLYNIGEDQNLIFQSFPDPEYDRTKKTKLIFEGRLENIDIIRNEKGDQLIACGDSTYLYESKSSRKILIQNRNSKFIDVKATNFDGVNTAWIVEKTKDDDYNLLFLTDNFYVEETHKLVKGRWTSDLLMKNNVHQFTCLKGNTNGNHLFLLNEENELSHLWQDPKTTLWKEDAITVDPLSDADAIIEFPCYTATINLKDKDTFVPIVEQEITVSSSSNAFVTINGFSYLLTPDKTEKIKTDSMGNITIIYPVEDDINTPLFYVEHEGLEKKQIINPSHKLEERLALIKSDTDFINAKTDDDKPLWETEELPENSDLNNGAEAIQKLLESRQQFILEENTNIKSSSSNKNTTWGVIFTEKGQIQHLVGNDAINHLNTLTNNINSDSSKIRAGWNPLKPIGHAFGSFFHWVSGAIGKIRSFIFEIIDGITTVILNIAGNIFTFVIDVIEKVFPFVKVILDALLIAFKTVLKWIGKLIGWDAIWDTHKWISKMTRNGTESLSNSMDRSIPLMKNSIHEYISHLQDNLSELTDSDLPEDIDPKNNLLTNVLGGIISPIFNWPMYHLLHSGALHKLYDITLGNVPFLNDFIEKQAEVYLYVEKLVQEEMDQIITFAKNPDFSTKGLLRLFEPILTRILTTVDKLIQGLLDFLVTAFKQALSIINSPIKIPFLTPMVSFIAKMMGEEIKEEITLLDGISLFVSFPVTITYKIINGGGRPFEEAPEGFGEPAMFDFIMNNKTSTDLRKNNSEELSDSEKILFYYEKIGGCVGSIIGGLNLMTPFLNKNPGFKKVKLGFSAICHIFTFPVFFGKLDSKNKKVSYSFRVSQYAISIASAYILPLLSKNKDDPKLPVPKTSTNIINFVLSTVTLGTNITSSVLSEPNTPGISWAGQMFSRASSLVAAGANFSKPPTTLYIQSFAAGFGLYAIGFSSGVALSKIDDDPDFGTFE